MRKIIHYSFYLVILGILAFACNPARNLSRDQTLYTGATFNRNAPDSVELSKELEEEVDDVIKPEPNAKLLGWYYRLGIHNLAGKKESNKKEKQSGLKYWLRNKLGRPPVLLENVNPFRTAKLIENKFYNEGFFDVSVTQKIDRNEEKRQGSATYTATYGMPYQLENRYYPNDSTILVKTITEAEQTTQLTQGSTYSLANLKEERERITEYLKNRGFFYFSPDFLLFQVDTTIEGRNFNLYMKLKEQTPAKAFAKYLIRDIYILPEFQTGSTISQGDTTITKSGFAYISHEREFRPETIARHIFLKKGKPYSFNDHQLTLQKLTSLDLFKFVNVRFRETDDGQLDAFIYLTPFKKKSIRLEANVVSKSNDFIGPGLNASFSNRNAFHGAERLSLDLNSSYETQIAGQRSGLNSFQVGGALSLRVFRFITPFKRIQQLSRFVPSTQLRVGYNLLNRVQFFRTSSFNLLFGYNWRETPTRSHELNPININYLALGRTSERFDEILADDQLLARSFENQFILGTSYSFTYNNQVREKKKNYVYFNGNIDLSGNVMHALQSAFRNQESTEENPFQIFNRPYSQYFRILTEFRFYEDIGNRTQLALRGITGLGVPFGNSSTLPYIKKFFIGGTNSIRAFPARSVGPGAYQTPESLANDLFLDQVGDIKIEANAELRFDINNFLKWAVFADVGNIWLTRENPDRPEGNFEVGDFYREFAVGIGTGMRIDVSYIILRFDLGIPVRKPSNSVGNRWVFKEFDFGSADWRNQNLVLNIAIGYPF